MPSIEGAIVPHLRRDGRNGQADEIAMAIAFGKMLDSFIDAAAIVTDKIEPQKAGIDLRAILRNAKLQASIGRVTAAAKAFLTGIIPEHFHFKPEKPTMV